MDSSTPPTAIVSPKEKVAFGVHHTCEPGFDGSTTMEGETAEPFSGGSC
jgi:hypothetical protein